MLRLSAFLVVLLVAGAAGCTSAPPVETAEQRAAASVESTPVSTPTMMGSEQKRSQIASNFPLEVPVVQGCIVRGRAQGSDAWDYQIEFAEDVRTVSLWYQQAYGVRNWALTADEPLGEGGTALSFQKGSAESRIGIEPLAGGSTRVTVVVGVGTPVLQTQ